MIVSECQADGNWSPVSLRCMFDPAAVARNMQRGRTVKWKDKEEMNLGTIIAIAVISALIIISLLIAFIVISHRRSSAVMRARKLSRMNGVKVLPDQVIKREVLDCMVSVCIFSQAGPANFVQNCVCEKYPYYKWLDYSYYNDFTGAEG